MTKYLNLGAFSADAASKLDVLGVDGNALGVDGTEVGVLKKTDKIGLGSLLNRKYGMRLKTKVRLEVLSNLTHKALERELAKEHLRRLLVFANLAQSYRARTVTMRLLDPTRPGCRLASGFGCKSLTWRFSAGRLPSSLFGTGHCSESVYSFASPLIISLKGLLLFYYGAMI